MKENLDHINDLLIKFLLGETDAGENQLVREWIAEDAVHQKHFQDFKLIWEESKRFAPSVPVDEQEAWKRFQQRMHNPAPKNARIISLNNMLWLRVAVILLFLVGATISYLLFFNQPRNITLQSASVVIRDTLPDGSIVTLNRFSSLTYPEKFTGDTRSVTMEGEVFFDITPNRDKPFMIKTNDVNIKVVGTSFNVRSIAGNTEVIVETGIVEVAKKDVTIQLRPKEKLLTSTGRQEMQKAKVEDKLYNYYASRQFVCDNTPLWKLVEILNEAYQVNIVIERKSLRNLPLTTTFDNESLDNILTIIGQTFNISVNRNGNQIILN